MEYAVGAKIKTLQSDELFSQCLRRAGIHTCRWWNGLPNDLADKDIRPTNFVEPVPILQTLIANRLPNQ